MANSQIEPWNHWNPENITYLQLPVTEAQKDVKETRSSATGHPGFSYISDITDINFRI